ncbi:hypothetical protein GQ55_3G124100 [Panicum hallii var. hallii]|uniref:Uncharacterized protein n=1 Tax=Panicum hallii var. hallii TaxID=1504633 RepID=A0A2T7E8P3_9POAL|nr:hypothetical protein GQ55_3G124100 [Panicum hallii var. hallii]
MQAQDLRASPPKKIKAKALSIRLRTPVPRLAMPALKFRGERSTKVMAAIARGQDQTDVLMIPLPPLGKLGIRDVNTALCRPFSEEERTDALFWIGPPEGFFQRNWNPRKISLKRVRRQMGLTSLQLC